jgi:hypothetical protein
MLLPLPLLPDPDGAEIVSASLEPDEAKFIPVMLWPCPPQPEPSCTKVVPAMLVLQPLRGKVVPAMLRPRPLQPHTDGAEVVLATLHNSTRLKSSRPCCGRTYFGLTAPKSSRPSCNLVTPESSWPCCSCVHFGPTPLRRQSYPGHAVAATPTALKSSRQVQTMPQPRPLRPDPDSAVKSSGSCCGPTAYDDK